MAIEDPNGININHIMEQVNAAKAMETSSETGAFYVGDTHVMTSKGRAAANNRQRQFQHYENKTQARSKLGLYGSQADKYKNIEINENNPKVRTEYREPGFSVPESASNLKPNKKNADLMKSAENRLRPGGEKRIIEEAKAGGGFKKFGYKALGIAALGAVAMGTINGIMNAGGRKTNAQLYSDPYT
jgi:hypothetical protein|nr:MAG TPA: hypothetical protein [Caudoviricetes sp.]